MISNQETYSFKYEDLIKTEDSAAFHYYINVFIHYSLFKIILILYDYCKWNSVCFYLEDRFGFLKSCFMMVGLCFSPL